MVNSTELPTNMNQSIKLPPNPATCLLEIVTTVNNVHSTKQSDAARPDPVAGPPLPAAGSVAVSKRLGRGAVTSGLTCECGVFAAMACGEWPTQRVSVNDTFQQVDECFNVFFISLGGDRSDNLFGISRFAASGPRISWNCDKRRELLEEFQRLQRHGND